MTEARVNLAARLDGVGTIVRQKETLDRVSEVLCDGLGHEPPERWRAWANSADAIPLHLLAARLRAIADLIESENL